jgi:hypothetical protein
MNDIFNTDVPLKTETPTFGNVLLYAAFSSIPLDIEGSNLENTGWMPSESDIKYMGEESYKLAVEECNLKTGEYSPGSKLFVGTHEFSFKESTKEKYEAQNQSKQIKTIKI